MELKYLNTFKTILETGSFQKAAEQLNYAQSTITLQMQLLEQELSVKLFEKIGRRMALTQAGKALLPYMDAVLEATAQMKNFHLQADDLTGALRIAMPETLLSYQIQPVLKAFRSRAPHVRLSLQMLNCYRIQEQILSGAVDLGLHYDIGGYSPSFLVSPLAHYSLALVGSATLDKEAGDFTTVGQQKDLCLLTPDRGSLYHKQFDSYLRSMAITLQGEMELGSIEAIKRSVAGDLGVAYVPRFTVETELQQGLMQEFATNMPHKELTSVCVYHKNKWIFPAMALFLQLLQARRDAPAPISHPAPV